MLRLNAQEVVARNIRRLQAQCSLSLNQVVERLGVSLSTASRLVNGDCRIIKHLDGLSGLWQVRYVEFWAEDGDTITPLNAREHMLVRHFRTVPETDRTVIEALLKRLAACAGRR